MDRGGTKRRVGARAVTDPRHERLHAVLKTLPSDFGPWGERSRDDDWGADCSSGCRWFVPLEGTLRYDWGVCHNLASPRSGLLTFEHQGCREFEASDDDFDAEEFFRHNPDESSAESQLLRNLHIYRTDIEELLAKASDHWGYEDPVYCFYHQNFKVYRLQEQTKAITKLLRKLSPSSAMNSWFLEIVESGTEKEFRAEDNKHWTFSTRPILEAFFHARFFLDMAARYRSLEKPPQTLPSGYAALLYLFGLR